MEELLYDIAGIVALAIEFAVVIVVGFAAAQAMVRIVRSVGSGLDGDERTRSG